MAERNSYFDSLKYILICFVVLGHIIQCSHKTELESHIYTFIYTFHMPLFVFISGYFSKNMTWEKLKRNYKLLLPAFILFQIIMDLPNIIEGNFNPIFLLIYPQATLWYILSLLSWRTIVYMISKNEKLERHPALIIGLSFLASFIIGIFDFANYFSILRTISFFPYFLFGYYCTNTLMSQITKINKMISATILLSIFVFIRLYDNETFTLSLYGTLGYDLYDSIYQGMLFRLMFYIVAISASCAVMSLLNIEILQHPKLSHLVGNTLGIYLLHTPIVYLLYSKIVHQYHLSGMIVILSVFISIMSLCAFLIKFKVFQWIINPSMIFKKRK